MKAKVYKIEIHDSLLSCNHGFGRKICEIHLPELKIAYNGEACFETCKERYKGKHARSIGEIEVPDEVVRNLKSYINAKKKLEKSKNWFGEQEFKKKFDKYQLKEHLERLNSFCIERKKINKRNHAKRDKK